MKVAYISITSQSNSIAGESNTYNKISDKNSATGVAQESPSKQLYSSIAKPISKLFKILKKEGSNESPHVRNDASIMASNIPTKASIKEIQHFIGEYSQPKAFTESDNTPSWSSVYTNGKVDKHENTILKCDSDTVSSDITNNDKMLYEIYEGDSYPNDEEMEAFNQLDLMNKIDVIKSLVKKGYADNPENTNAFFIENNRIDEFLYNTRSLHTDEEIIHTELELQMAELAFDDLVADKSTPITMPGTVLAQVLDRLLHDPSILQEFKEGKNITLSPFATTQIDI